MATKEEVPVSPTRKISFAGWPKGSLWAVVVNVGLYGQRSET